MSEASDREVDAALDRCERLITELLTEGPPDRVMFILVASLQMLHVASPSQARQLIEEHARHALAAMYAAPTVADVTAGRAEFRVGGRRRRL